MGVSVVLVVGDSLRGGKGENILVELLWQFCIWINPGLLQCIGSNSLYGCSWSSDTIPYYVNIHPKQDFDNGDDMIFLLRYFFFVITVLTHHHPM